jgi:dolichol-phosphate mannosyltransferase
VAVETETTIVNQDRKLISIVVPVHNEEENIPVMYAELRRVVAPLPYDFEFIFVNDGSTDRSSEKLESLARQDRAVEVLEFTRNFGKEAATTAGLSRCRGAACILIDGDLQHPVEHIPEFLEKWEKGADVVIGVRKKSEGERLLRRIGSYLFYLTINTIAETEITPRATDYRLLDRAVVEEFRRMHEKNRMTRALVDWMGYERDFVYFTARERTRGRASYSYLKLVRLALSSYIAHSLVPLKIAGYLGMVITALSGLLGVFMIVDMFVLADAYRLHFTGAAMLATMTLFLVGIALICLGLIALYIGQIHREVIDRPLYIIKKRRRGWER